MTRILSFLALACAFFASPVLAQVGGGYTHAGLDGQYFDNPNLTGQPKFSRRDVRLDFTWGTLLPIGGSNAEPYHSFPHNDFSVRWTGEIIPRFSEAYTFVAGADEGVRVKVGQKTVVENWNQVGSQKSEPIELRAGQKYPISVEYHQGSGPAFCTLKWQSASTPLEVIDVTTHNALNAATWKGLLSADAVKTGRAHWEGSIAEDQSGSPMADGQYIAWEGSGGLERTGTYRIQFNGKAKVGASFDVARFEADGKIGSGLDSGQGYDAKTNTTTALMHVTRTDAAILVFSIKDSQRTADSPLGSGISGLHIMRPVEPGSKEPHNIDEIFYHPFKDVCANYSALRWLQIANVHSTGLWADRTKPDYLSFTKEEKGANGGEKWEVLIELANECGKDLYLTTPVNADNDYFLKLAQLLKFGSDGNQPYTAPVANPVYPPLNPNLRVYFEVGNEIWNWGFASTQDANKIAEDEKKANTDEARVFNYNGKGNYRTWHALRTVRASDIFRSVFGDVAMGTRIRPLIEYQYNNLQDTALQSLGFIDAYFNNGDGDHVAQPHPVSYYIGGGGGAAYYGVGNNEGRQSETSFADAGFEEVVVPNATEQKEPVGGHWTFKGNAGLYRQDSVALSEQVAGGEMNLGGNTLAGFQFKVGSNPIWVKSVGRFAKQGQQLGDFCIVRADDKTLVAKANGGQVRGGWMQQLKPGYFYTSILGANKEAVRLEANTRYYLLVGGNVQLRDDKTSATNPTPEISIEGAAKADTGGKNDLPESWKWVDGAPEHGFGPLNFRFRTSDSSEQPAYPTVAQGAQAAFVRGTGEFSQSVNFSKSGDYALILHAASNMKSWPNYMPFDIFCDDQKASPMNQGDYRIAEGKSTAGIGGFARNIQDLHEEYGSAVFHIKEPGQHTIRFVGRGRDDQSIVFDELSIAYLDAIMESGFGAGSAFGQVASNNYQKQLDAQASYALAFGLPVVAYEAGWSLGGDFNAKPIQSYAKFQDERARQINNTAMQIFQSSGGSMNTWGVYTYWPANDTAHAGKYPLMQSISDINDRLSQEQTNGAPLPTTLQPGNAMSWHYGDNGWKGDFDGRGPWKSWLVVAPSAGTYMFKVNAAKGGSYTVEVDGQKIGQAADSGVSSTFSVRLLSGTHGVRIQSTSGTWTLHSVEIKATVR